MNKTFNGREIELLAPVGTFEDFKKLLSSGADAFYMGGKNFNMRMHRKEHNLTDIELERAAYLAHEKGKKVYITVNNLMSSDEMQKSKEYLKYLHDIQPDALIIQDFGLIKLMRDENLNLNMHLSVMANVHNLPMVRKAQNLGISRIVASRELALADIKSFVKEVPEMEYEYFIHGDMCSVHGAQCYYSGMLFGKSSNRGLCLKPCRWPYEAGKEKNRYLLAVKDICLFRHIPELILSGVNSFKIEGRMRSSDYLVSIIDNYRESIDRYIEDPAGYCNDEKMSKVFYKDRVRNLSTAYAFKKPGIANIDITGEREPRIFSKAAEESGIEEEEIREIETILETGQGDIDKEPNLAVKVNNLDAFKRACDSGADLLYLAGEVFRPDKPFSKKEIKEAVEYAKNKKIYYVLPRMAYERQFVELGYLIPELKKLGICGLIVGNLGELHEFYDEELEFRGEFNLNIYNEIAASFYENNGLSSVTFSVEASKKDLKTALLRAETPVELIVQGTLGVMYLEHCLIAANNDKTSNDFCRDYCADYPFELKDENGTSHKVYSDQYCKNHIITTKDICYLPILKSLKNLGVQTFRIEGQHYNPEQVGKVVEIYRKSINDIEDDNWGRFKSQIIEVTKRKQSFQALNY